MYKMSLKRSRVYNCKYQNDIQCGLEWHHSQKMSYWLKHLQYRKPEPCKVQIPVSRAEMDLSVPTAQFLNLHCNILATTQCPAIDREQMEVYICWQALLSSILLLRCKFAGKWAINCSVHWMRKVIHNEQNVSEIEWFIEIWLQNTTGLGPNVSKRWLDRVAMPIRLCDGVCKRSSCSKQCGALNRTWKSFVHFNGGHSFWCTAINFWIPWTFWVRNKRRRYCGVPKNPERPWRRIKHGPGSRPIRNTCEGRFSNCRLLWTPEDRIKKPWTPWCGKLM